MLKLVGALPIVRLAEIRREEVIFAPQGVQAVDLLTRQDRALAPAIYVSTADPRTDEEIRASIEKWQGV